MATEATDPIIIASDDESDNDDVVLIKEEIEVDCEDVIFLSETKATPKSDIDTTRPARDSGITLSESQTPLTRNISITSCAAQLSLDDSNDTDILDNILGNTSACTDAAGPLDLSSKSIDSTEKDSATVFNGKADSTDQNAVHGSDSDSSFMMLLTGSDPSLQTSMGHSLETKSEKTATVDTQCDVNTQCDTKGAVSSVDDTVNNLAGCLSNSDLCSNDPTNSGFGTSLCDSSVGNSSHPASTDSGWSAFNISPSTQATSANQQSDSNLNSRDPYLSTAAIGCIVSTCKDGDSSVIANTVVGQCVSSNQTGQQDTDASSDNQSAISSNQVSAVQTLQDTNNSDSNRSCLQTDAKNQRSAIPRSSFDLSDPFQASHALLASLDMTLNSGIQSQTGSVNQISQSPSSPGAQSACQTGSVIIAGGQSTNFTSGLLGGSVQCIQQPLSQQVGSSISSDASASSNVFKRSLSMTDTSPPYYNSLTLPLSQQNKPYQRSVSSSSFGAFKSGPNSSYNDHVIITQPPRSPSPQNSHHLPPKKQKRCYSDATRDFKCTNCEVNLMGEKSSRCPSGHVTCTKCLEERVKLVLTGRAKESVKCLSKSCDSYYPISELRHSLPAMVVEILEDKLDQDYVDYISDMIMKNASEELEQDSASADLDQAEDGSDMRYLKKYEDCPGNWEPMDERDVNREGYVLVPLETESADYQNVVLRFFDSMVDHSVEVTAVHRVQNPIQWKYYTVKKSEMLRDSGGFTSVVEGQLFHGTSSSAVEAICRKGFDWRLCGKHGTLYGQGSYFAVNASYSHQYTDLRRPHGSLRSSMTFSQPTSMTLPTAPPLLFPPVNVNFGQPLHPVTPVGISVIQTNQYRPMNLSHNATGTGSQSVVRQISQTGAQVQTSSSQNLGNNSGASQFGSSANVSLTNPAQPGPSGSGSATNFTHYIQNILSMPTSDNATKRKIIMAKRRHLLSCSRKILPKSVAAQNIAGLASTAYESEEIERPKARVFFARVLVGKYTTGNPKLRKPPPLYMNSDQFGKSYDSCVDNEADPKIFVIFDSTQAYPEYLVEYTYSEDKLF